MNFLVESNYPIRIFKENKMEYSWNTIKVGLDLNRLTAEEVRKFALEYLEQHPGLVNEYISELILDVGTEEIDTCVKKIFESLNLEEPKKYTSQWNKEWFKWRYCIMNEMVKSILDEDELLTHIEGVYADFDYPEDMTEFIYYMPYEENLEGQEKDPKKARSNLVKKLKIFLEKERAKIIQNININKLPDRVIERN